jgi:hypothetical protein
MTLKLYLEGTNAGIGMRVWVAKGVKVTVGVAGGLASGRIAVAGDGPKGVGVREESGLGVTEGPMAVEGIEVPKLVQAKRSNKDMQMNIERQRQSMFIFSSTTPHGGDVE